MRRHTLSSILALLTFAMGVGCTLLSYNFIPPAVSLCDLARHPEWYDQKVVRVTGSASALYGSVVISDTKCEAEGAWAAVILDEKHKVAPDVGAFLTGEAPEVRKAEIRVMGRFDQDATPGCFGPRFGIRVTSVELESPVTVEPLPERHE
jgi:hypothetical protein